MAFNPLPTGTLLSKRYKIVNLIRQGGMGATYRGEDLETGKMVAVKELVDSFESSRERESGIGNFLAEMRVLKELNHPQIPKILDHFLEKERFFFVLEYVEGKDFTRKLEESGRAGFDENAVIQIGIEACHVLEYLHEKKPPIVHKDIKSSNLIERKKDGRIMVVDFGISKAAKPGAGMMIGTPGYSPPEQHLNQADSRSDIFALGATLHELSTGRRPDPDDFQFIPPCDIRPDISTMFSEIIMTAVQYLPEDRFQEARDFEEALQGLLPRRIRPLETDPFEKSCADYARQTLFPILGQIQQHHLNECESTLPKNLNNGFTFTLGIQIPHSLIVHPNPEKQSISFFLKEGILSKTFLGEILLSGAEAQNETRRILERFLASYEK